MSATAINATWVWVEVSPDSFWLKVKATLLDPYGAGVSNRAISIYEGASYIIDKITDANGYIEYNFAGLTGTKTFNFYFDGDAEYAASNKTITVEYLDPPTPPPPPPPKNMAYLLIPLALLPLYLGRR